MRLPHPLRKAQGRKAKSVEKKRLLTSRRAASICQIYEKTGTPLGMYGAGDGQIMEESVALDKGDFIIAQTDGLIECFNKKNEPFDRLKSQEKFMGAIKEGRTAQQVIDAVMEKVRTHMGKDRDFDDDVTLVVLKKT